MHIISPDNLDAIGVQLLEKKDGVTVDAHAKMSRDDLLKAAPQADGLIVRSASTIDAEMFAALTKVKAIARAGVGVDNIDLDAATERGVVVMNAPDGNTIATAEHTLAEMLALARHVPQAYAAMREGRWDRKAYTGTELRGKTLGIVGFGRVGRAVAQRARAFEMTVLAYDPFMDDDVAHNLHVTPVGLDNLLSRSDYITLHAVVTNESREMINAANIAKMKNGVRIINVARGSLINETDLAEAIKAGKVAGAALDVYSQEPPPEDNPLVGLDGVVHTPHLGASTHEAQEAVAIQAVQNLLDALLKGEYRNVMNPAVLDKLG
ncbi:MAG: hydroxyacid dehydrogenase [Anaerolineales bacterium]